MLINATTPTVPTIKQTKYNQSYNTTIVPTKPIIINPISQPTHALPKSHNVTIPQTIRKPSANHP